MRLPNVQGVLSDNTKIGWKDLDQSVTELLYQNIITDNFDNLDAWTVVDSGGNVNLVNNVVEMNGSGTWNANGIWYTAGISRAKGYFEIKIKGKNIGSDCNIFINNTTGLIIYSASGQVSAFKHTSLKIYSYADNMFINLQSPITVDTWYTIRIYPILSSDNLTWKSVKLTIEGGEFSNETIMALINYKTVEFASTLYFGLNRYANSAGNLVSFKEFKAYFGYDTSGEYATYTHDAGSGKVFNNFDPSALAMPGGMSSTNNKFRWAFYDSSPSLSSWLTLAQLNAVGKQTANHRYIRIDVQNNSGGTNQVNGSKPVSNTVTDGIGDFPAVGNVYLSDTVQGVTGTYDKIYSAVEEALRNSDPGVTNVFLNIVYKILNVVKTGTLSIGAPGIPSNLTATALSFENIKLTWDPAANTETYYIYHSNDNIAFTLLETLTGSTFAIEYTHTGLTAESTHYYKIKAENNIGQSEYSEIISTITSATVIAPTTINPIMDFYQITNSDSGDAIETLRHENIFGDLQMSEVRVGDDKISFEIIQLYIFYPEKYLDNIEKNMKVVSGDNTEFKIITIEDFDGEHQEIKLKKIKD